MFGSLRRLTVVAGSIAALAVGKLVATPSAVAYGGADQPVGQVEVSANYHNPPSVAPTDFWWTSIA